VVAGSGESEPARLRGDAETAAVRVQDEVDLARLAVVIAAGKRGDCDAISYLFDRFADDVRRYVSSIVRDEHEAEDITQNVFVKLMRILPKYEERAVPFSAWLMRVARNVALDHLRSRRMIPCEEVRSIEHQVGDDQLERDWSLHAALRSMSAEQRRVVLWRHLGGLSPVEIAERLGRSEGAVHALHHRGRRAIRAELEAMGAAPSTMARRPKAAARTRGGPRPLARAS